MFVANPQIFYVVNFIYIFSNICNFLMVENYYEVVGFLFGPVCWSGLRDLEAYSLLGGGVPIPEHRLSRSLDSVPLFSLL